MQSSLPYCVLIIQALGPTFVAIAVGFFAAVIGFRQWKTSVHRLRFDLYEKRYSIYDAARLLIQKIRIQGQIIPSDVGEFSRALRGSEFLFQGQTRSYVLQLSDLAFKAHLARRRQSRTDNEEKLQELIDEEIKILDFLEDQDSKLEKIFGPYLDLSKVGI